jgi:hypothetical protein
LSEIAKSKEWTRLVGATLYSVFKRKLAKNGRKSNTRTVEPTPYWPELTQRRDQPPFFRLRNFGRVSANFPIGEKNFTNKAF